VVSLSRLSLLLSTALLLPSVWSPVPAAAAAVAPKGDPVAVTLITGDRVLLGAPDATGRPFVQIEPHEQGRAFSVRRDAGRVTVIPQQVEKLVPDVLDPALFDVTGLVEMGYDDAHRADLPVITRGVPDFQGREIPSLGATAGTLAKQQAPGFTSRLASLRSTGKVWLDRRLKAAVADTTAAIPDQYLNQIKAPTAWAKGLDGRGVKVAVLDTGVDAGHPALTGKVSAESDFTGSASAADDNGHGTHVSSLIVGSGAGSDGARQGVAPAAELISGKVLAADGYGQESWVIAGMEWAAAQGADLVNLSLSSAPSDGDDPVAEALERLTAETGTLFVASAGNNGNLGEDPGTIGSPGVAASALTVGAVNGNDKQAVFSSEGPTRGTYRLKPDLTAPGIDILGARAGARDGDLYVGMSGTSQAAPIVTGAAALMLQQHPSHTWKQLKADLTTAADSTKSWTNWASGNGRLDLARATSSTLTSDVSSLDFAYLRYPDKAARSQVVTLTNSGSTPITVPVTDQETSSTDVPAPATAVVASPATLTIPAGGTASTKITIDPAQLTDGLWQGTVAFGDNLRLALGAYDEAERYDLSVKVLDRTGTPYAGGTASVFNYATGNSSTLHLDENGTARVRLEPGQLVITSAVVTPAAGSRPETFALAGTAELPFTRDTSYVIDARKAQVLRAPTVEGQKTKVVESVLGISRNSATRGLSDFWWFEPEQIAAGTVFVQPTAKVAGGGSFETTNRWRLEPVGAVRKGEPTAYELLFAKDRFSLPLSPHLTRRDLAKMARVENSFGSLTGAGTQQVQRQWATTVTGVGWVTRRDVAVPSQQVELLTADPASGWGQCLTLTADATTPLCDRQILPLKTGARVQRPFGAALHPDIFAAYHAPDYMFVEVGVADAFHAGRSVYFPGDHKVALYRNGALVGELTDSSGYFPLPEESGKFRLEQSWSIAPAVFPRSGSAHTTWNFTSAPPPDPTQQGQLIPPLLSIGYDADVDGLGRATAWRPLRIGLLVGHQVGSKAARVTGAKLSYSTDGGKRWTPAFVVPAGGAYTAVIPPWAVLPGKSLSLRAVATDAAGGTIDQTVIAAIPTR